VVSIIVLIIGIFICINRLNRNTYNNMYISNLNVSNMSKEKVISLLEKEQEKISSVNLTLVNKEKELSNIKAEDIDLKIDINKAISDAFSYGRKDNIIIDNIKILKAYFKKVNIELVYNYDDKKLDDIYKNCDLTIDDRYIEDKYSIDEINHNLNIIRGKTGRAIDQNGFNLDIINLFKNKTDSKYDVKVIDKKPESISVDLIYSEVKRDPIDASIDESVSPTKFINEKVGYDFNKDELQKVLDLNKEEGKEINFKLNVTEPKVKLANLTYNLFKDKLTGYTTYFNSGDYARSTNISIALSYINGKIIMPGETFSFLKTIGNVTVAKGYLPAGTFKGGRVVMETGGGVCQTSSTLYNVALMANLEVTERHAHGLPVGYVPPSRDATIYEYSLDLKFKNTRKYPIKIVTAFSKAGNMNMSIYGTKEDTEYDIVLTHEFLGNVPYTTEYIYDNTMNKGETKVIFKGVNGYNSRSFITKKLNGKVVESKLLSKDSYSAQRETLKVGTNESQAVIKPNPPIYGG
ncbi:MAG: VanW family protein, partial [Clostridia bacterium]